MRVLLVVLLGVAVLGACATRSSGAYLYLTWLGVVDNGEGREPPHGPYGSLHISAKSPTGFVIIEDMVLGGPTRTPKGTYEFLDGDQANYSNLLVGTVGPGPYQGVRVKIWESDPTGGVPRWLAGRKNDVLFDAFVTQPGLWLGVRAHNDGVEDAAANGARAWVDQAWDRGMFFGMPAVFVWFDAR
jgi:hypothetical protein